MAKPADSSASQVIPTIDLSPFTRDAGQAKLVESGKKLVEICRRFGFAKISGHGMTTQEVEEALSWAKRLFDLPYEDKMKAPHPPANMPHRGYSPIGQEKVYSKSDVALHGSEEKVAESLRSISDFKESYEIGSDRDGQQQNIWLPEDVLPHFRAYTTSLYERLADVAQMIIEAYAVGLGLSGEDFTSLTKLHARDYNQLRLLHYPEVSKEILESKMITRMPAHQDWGTFTMLFQDERGGLELQDPQTSEYLHAQPEEGTLLLNVGDMLERFTNVSVTQEHFSNPESANYFVNRVVFSPASIMQLIPHLIEGYFLSAMHRVALPPTQSLTSGQSISPRYSIPYFVAPHPEHLIETLPRFVSEKHPYRYKAVKFQDYGAEVSEHMYKTDVS